VFYVLGWGIPTILTIIALAAKKIGYIKTQQW
jgi:hypothetical protein